MFEGLKIKRAATNVRLTFEAGQGCIGLAGSFTGLDPFPMGQVAMVHTIWFNVLIGDIAQIAVRTQPGGCSLDENRQGIPCTRSPLLELRDLGGNVVSAADTQVANLARTCHAPLPAFLLHLSSPAHRVPCRRHRRGEDDGSAPNLRYARTKLVLCLRRGD